VISSRCALRAVTTSIGVFGLFGVAEYHVMIVFRYLQDADSREDSEKSVQRRSLSKARVIERKSTELLPDV
jgi:hypothetical protein